MAELIWKSGTLAHARPTAIEIDWSQNALMHELWPYDACGLTSTSPLAYCRPMRGIETAIGGAIFSAIGSGLFSTGLAGAIGVNAFNAVVTALTYTVGFGALAGASYLLGGGAQKQAVSTPETQKQSYELEDGPRTIVLGRARVGGVFALRASTGYDTYRLLAQCQGPIDAIEEYYVKDREVTVDFDGTVSSPPYARSSGSYLALYSKLGTTDQTAFSELTSAFSENWTSDHRLRGVACTVAKFTSPGVTSENFLKVWPEGYPTFDALVRGERIYDPRKDSTTTDGSGSHRTDDYSTWEWSNNGVLCVLWNCTAPEEKGGFGLSFDQFDLDDIALEATKADATQDSKAGADAERRSVCSGSYTTDRERATVLAEIMQSTGCRMARTQDGKYTIRLEDDNPAPTVTIASQNILDVVWGGDEIVTDANQLSLFFHSPERQWKMAELEIEGKSWAQDTVSIAKSGRRTETLQLKFCPQPGQAQRIARKIFMKRRAGRGTLTTNLGGLMAMGHLDGTAEMDVMEYDWEAAVEFGSPRLSEEKTEVEVPVVFRNTLSEWSVADDEVDAPEALEDIQFSGDVGTPEITSLKYVKTGASTSAIRIRFSAADDATGYEGTYRTWDGSISGARTAMTESAGNRWAVTASGISLGARYILEVRGSNDDGDLGNWSEEEDYTTAYDTTAPTGCTATMTLTDDSPLTVGAKRTYTVTAVCTDLNTSQIESVYVDPHETVTVRTHTVSSYEDNQGTPTWPDAPTGSVVFYNSTGQSTTVNY